jgi:CRISPR/Cas system endoribonuclease Cas6 (RAMP superfamily)
MAVHEWLHMKHKISTETKFLNLCQDGENASMGFGIMLKSSDIPVE